MGKNALYGSSIERSPNQVKQLEEKAMVMFYAHWCPHCVDKVDLWKALAKKKPAGVAFYAINCADESDFCSQMGVMGFPTMRLWTGSRWIEYGGPRDEDSITAFVSGGMSGGARRRSRKRDAPKRARKRVRNPKVCGRKTQSGGRCKRRGVCPYHTRRRSKK